MKDVYTDKVQITAATLLEIRRAFRVLAKDENSYVHKVFSDDYCFEAIQELRKVHNEYFETDESFTLE